MPNRIRNGRYGRKNRRPRSKRRPRDRVASSRFDVTAGGGTSDVTAGEGTSSLLLDLVGGRLRRLPEPLPERRQQRAQRLAGDELRDDRVRPHGLVGIGDDVPALPDLV